MRPAGSVITFTSLSGAGFGMFVLLALGLPSVAGWSAFWYWFLAYGLAVSGLLSSILHLPRPSRAIHAFSQWSSSWLSREGVFAVAALLVAAPLALAQIFLARHWLFLGMAVALLALLTVLSTAMIYAQLRAVPRWNTVWTPVLYLTHALTSGVVLTGQGWWAVIFLLVLAAVQIVTWIEGGRRFSRVGATLAGATGQTDAAAIRLFERSHTARDWVMQEMAFRIARKHRRTLRIIGLGLVSALPALLLALVPAGFAITIFAAGLHLMGTFVCRWLFFAESEHVVGLYYGR
jgi:DMSO reductase anchor subunit